MTKSQFVGNDKWLGCYRADGHIFLSDTSVNNILYKCKYNGDSQGQPWGHLWPLGHSPPIPLLLIPSGVAVSTPEVQ